MNISFVPDPEASGSERKRWMRKLLDKTDLYLLAVLNTIEKVRRLGFQYKDIVILTRKRDQGIAVANYLTEQKIPLLSSETLMIQNATEVRLIIHLLKYLRNHADAESKAHFLQHLAKNHQDKLPIHDFIAQGMALSNESEFEKWLMGIDIELNFQNIRKKSLYEAVELIIKIFLPPAPSEGGGALRTILRTI